MANMGTLIEIIERYGNEAACFGSLIEHRWPEGFQCPACGDRRAYIVETRLLLECTHCGHQTSVTAGTIFHKTRTSLQKWFLAIYLIAATKKATSASELCRQLGIAYQTAWTMRRKIVHAMMRRPGELMLRGIVELDESLIGGRERGKHGRETEHKTLVAIAVDHTMNGGCRQAHMQVIQDASAISLTGAATASIKPGSTVLTDGWQGYNGLSDQRYNHKPMVLSCPEDASKFLPWVHITISNFKRWILDVFHGVSPKHIQAYLDEFCYRLNRRWQREDLFRRVLNRCSRFATPVTYAQLTAS